MTAGGGRVGDYVRALRPHQAAKNVLVFAPLVAGHVVGAAAIAQTVAVFMGLSLCAFGSYLINDILDRPYDRKHPTKRHRPIASGRVPVAGAGLLAAGLIGGGLAIAAFVGQQALLLVVAYLALSAAYSLILKRKTFIDVVTLACLYTVRVLIGSAAAEIPVSQWFIIFSIFFFMALAIIKRQREIARVDDAGHKQADGRNYFAEDRAVLSALAAASGFAAVVVFALYLSSAEVAASYSRPELLWGLCPVIIYWLGRMLLLANRGHIHDDPVVFALTDRVSLATGALFMAIVIWAV
ncbi:MAG: UbiA family prenyltransferase [Alphaproteobacteria bacterium]